LEPYFFISYASTAHGAITITCKWKVF